MKIRRAMLAACVLAGSWSVMGCSGPSIEDRAREAAEKAKDTSFGPDFEGLAIAQPIDPGVAKEVQENLTTIHEYQGEITGKLDSVTVNAIQAFQRTTGLKDDGLVTERTRTALQAAANAARPGGGAAAGAH